MATIAVPQLKITPRPGGYARGQEGVAQILQAALTILVEHGAPALTLRRIAAECGMKAGHLAYYFKTKEELLRELLDAIVSGYEDAFAAIVHDPHESAERRFERLVTLILEDITTKRTTRLFPALWALANHDPFVQDRVEEMYARARVALDDLIAQINPALAAGERELVALFVSASMEGMTMFAGYDKPWRSRMAAIEHLAARSFLALIRSLRSGEIAAVLGGAAADPGLSGGRGPDA